MTAPEFSIFGYGHVGRRTHELFPEAVVFDPALPEHNANRESAESARCVFVCVPTPEGDAGRADLREVRNVLARLRPELVVLRSTVPPGSTDALAAESDVPALFFPEFVGEWSYPVAEVTGRPHWPYCIVGGDPRTTDRFIETLATRMGPTVSYHPSDARTAELVKYMSNAWLALQVSFAHEFAGTADALGVSYWRARELWSLDPRVTAAHTVVDRNDPGFAGKCLPKDAAAIVATAADAGVDMRILQTMLTANADLRTDPRLS